MPGAVPTRSCRLLMVEDNDGDAELLGEAFADAGWRADIAVIRDGLGALRRIEALAAGEGELPHLALLDAGLPGVSGFELYHRLRSLPALARLPALVFSGGHPDGLRKRGIPAEAIVPKPDTWDGYVEVLRRLLALLDRPAAIAGCAKS